MAAKLSPALYGPSDQRGGIYKLPMPYILGNESSGEVVAVGEGVDFQVGDKVAVSAALLSPPFCL